MKKMKVCISRCLLGDNVRYNGKQKFNCYIDENLSEYFEWIPVCPEVECGLPVPREAMQLEGDPANPSLMTIDTREDLTAQMQRYITEKLQELDEVNIAGFISKIRSPSCGMRDVPIFSRNGESTIRAAGLFTHAFKEFFPDIPVEDEESLLDAETLEKFKLLSGFEE